MGVVIRFRVPTEMQCAIVSNYYPESTCVPTLGAQQLHSLHVGKSYPHLTNNNNLIKRKMPLPNSRVPCYSYDHDH